MENEEPIKESRVVEEAAEMLAHIFLQQIQDEHSKGNDTEDRKEELNP